ncbi:MAG TPA: M1 family aminopeptidase/hydrolase, partial [Vicinamibacterales bacterium]|nr:M1 family aminopeptidase/hydrolase [Vicinamibacterales bacterium]
MKPHRLLVILAAVVFPAAACRSAQSEQSAAQAIAAIERDVHSSARPEEARVTHVALDLSADFGARVLAGTATLTIDATAGAGEIVLDTRDLVIEAVEAPDGTPLRHSLGAANPILGRPLTIQLPPGVREIVVRYRTSPDAAALQWLTPAQTAGGRHPYLYSQGQAILTRTWIPTQDSPGIRQTYSARITVPRGLRAVMSAEPVTPEGQETAGGRVFEFQMAQPIPPYLVALAIGDLGFRSLGARTGVYTEPPVLESAAAEFADVEQMVAAAERLLGPYRWERYDLLVLPPSFPFGGMENPRLTFATPTIIAGDRSLVALVAHELAHSWSGNLVTNATWSDFWLNEGVTTYLERRLMEALYGAERAATLEVLGRRELQDELNRLMKEAPGDTILHIDLAGRNPDDAVTSVAYEKGAALLRLVERTVGRERFDAYLRSYFDRHAFTSITTAAFLADLRQHLIRGDEALERRLRLDEWVYQPGLPDNAPVVRSAALEAVERQAQAFAGGARASTLMTAAWSTQEWQHFLQALPPSLTPAQVADL